MNSFNTNFSILAQYVSTLDPDFTNYQIDVNSENLTFIFSLSGNCVLNSPNKDVLKFILSFRVCFNLSNLYLICSEKIEINKFVSIDFIKIKIFN